MLDGSRKQYTAIIKECIEGIRLINSLKNSDSLSKEKCEKDILESKNKMLGLSFKATIKDPEDLQYAKLYVNVPGGDKSSGTLEDKEWSWDKKDWNWEPDQKDIDKRLYRLVTPWTDSGGKFDRSIEKGYGVLYLEDGKKFEADCEEM